MKVRMTTLTALITSVFLMTVAAGQALAGGLKDTSYEFFSTVGFPADPSDSPGGQMPTPIIRRLFPIHPHGRG